MVWSTPGTWIMALTASVLAVLGTLVGVGIVSFRDGDAFLSASGGNGTTQTLTSNNFWDAAMLLFAATTAGMLALCLHLNDHHRIHNLSRIEDRERGMWGLEHALSYLIGLGSIIYVIIGLLAAFNAFSADHDQGNGLVWMWFGLAAATVTTALHVVRHHQTAVEEDHLAGLVEERLRRRGTTPTAAQQPGAQRS